MIKFRNLLFILFSILFVIIFTSCPPLLELDDDDWDMDGIPAYDDVDDIMIYLADTQQTFDTTTPVLTLKPMNPSIVTKFWIQISHSDSQFDDFIFYSKDDYGTNECAILPGILYDAKFYWRAKAWDNIEKRWSNSWSYSWAFTVDTGNLGIYPPHDISISDTTPLFDWPDIPGAVAYNIKIGNPAIYLDIDNLAQSQYQMSDILPNGFTKSWQIRHKNAEGLWGDWSQYYLCRIWVSAPVNPKPLDGGMAKSPKAFLNWEDVEDIGTYRVFVKDSSTGTTLIDTTVTDSHYKVDLRLEYGKEYLWKVRSQNTDGIWGTNFGEVEWQFGITTINFTENIIDSNYNTPLGAHIVDLDDDGDSDIITAAFFDDTVSWWENNGTGTFTQHLIDSAFDGGGRAFDAVDMDKDGDMDIIGGSYTGGKLVWWKNNGEESFTKHEISATFDGAWKLATADFNGDTEIDIVGSASSAGFFIWWENDGNGIFTQHTISSTFLSPKELAIVDIDEDNDIDIFGATNANHDIIWLENDGAGSFTETIINTVDFNFASSVRVMDLNGDGNIDIIGASEDNDEISWWENDGNENFTKHLITSTVSPSYIHIEDLNMDDAPDIIVSDGGLDKVFWFENDGIGTFTERTVCQNIASSVPKFLSSSDFDGDGDPDLLELLQSSDDILWWENDARD